MSSTTRIDVERLLGVEIPDAARQAVNVLAALLSEVMGELDEHPGDVEKLMESRERVAALAFELGLFDLSPDPEIEFDLFQDGLLLRTNGKQGGTVRA